MKAPILKNPRLAPEGKKRIDYISDRMPVLGRIRREFQRSRPLRGLRVVACLHVTVETANLIRTLRAGGARVALTGSNPLSTQDDIAAALAREGVHTYAFRGQSPRDYYRCIQAAVELRPQVVLDDGADVIATLHEKRRDLIEGVMGACEETTTGVVRLRALERQGRLRFPVLAVNDAETKMMFDNRYGTGQSTLHGVMNATNILFAGRTVVVAGYGWCGRGIASRARGLGADVIVVEVHPRKALEAVMDGYRVMPMTQAAALGEVFITATGDTGVLRPEHFRKMRDGAILANTGHFNVEVDIQGLRRISRRVRAIRENLAEYTLKNGRRLHLLADGRLVNLAAAQGHPPEVMDMSFANQALGVRHLTESEGTLEPRVYPIPPEIDNRVAQMKLETLGVHIESLTREQERYLSSWELGT